MLKRKSKSKTATKSSKLPIVRRGETPVVTTEEEPVAPVKKVVAAKAEGTPVAETPVVTVAPTDVPPVAPTDKPPTSKKTTVRTANTTGKLSCLDAAAEILKTSGQPMRCKELVEAMEAKGLWASTAPTPHQTLASALMREVKVKGDKSRFRKADRGQFALAQA